MPADVRPHADAPFLRTQAAAAELRTLHSAAAVRARSRLVQRWVAQGRSPHFMLDDDRLPAVARYVAQVTRAAYPDLKIPPHSRWRHFAVEGRDRWGELAAHISDPLERARCAVDLATVSVLLDAGAGHAWRYRVLAGLELARSEGLAVASFDMFRAGAFSSDRETPWRVDAGALKQTDAATLGTGLRVTDGNPLIGLSQRATLLRRLGHALDDRPDLFGSPPGRPGVLVDHFRRTAADGRVAAASILAALLEGFSSIWPSGLVVHGFAIGDAGCHPAVQTGDASEGIIPFHKLSQWLTYSLIEPLEAAGFDVQGTDELTALAEYRNGGLLIDLGTIRARTPAVLQQQHEVTSELIVEWRALTVSLFDALLPMVRKELGLDASFTMPQLLQGGTWSAGRKIAGELRPPDGPPPLTVLADGTVF